MRCGVGLNTAQAAGQHDCESPPDCDGAEPVRTVCYRCGQPACKSCSWLDHDPFVHRRTRRCRDCREHEPMLV